MNEHDDELGLMAPTPQEWDFPERPNHRELQCWENQQRFLRQYATRGKIALSAADAGLTACAVEKWQRTDKYGFNKRLELAYQAYRELLEEEMDEYIRDSKHNVQILQIFRLKAAWREKYGDNVQITTDAPVKQMLEQMRQIGLAQQRALDQGAAEGDYRELGETDRS
jgi:hypothetical protein